jgi:molybdopterin-containing oxidoreductase family membrane subunit
MRRIFNYQKIITIDVLENVAKTIIFTGLIVAFAYGTEFFMAWYSRNPVELEVFRNRPFGDYAKGFWIMAVCNTILPLVFFFRFARRSLLILFMVSILVNIGMWFDRFVIIVTGVSRDFIPHTWGLYTPTWVEFGIMIGSFSLFFFLFMLFVKHLPSVSMTKMKEMLGNRGGHGG